MISQPPIIGVTAYGRAENGNFFIPSRYLEAVRAAGGVPVLLPPGETHLQQVLELVDGLVFSGGGDIEPRLYGAPEHPTIYTVDPERDAFELALAQSALEQDHPILGICRGLQVMAVASGGDLMVHLPDEVGFEVLHRQDELRQPIAHRVRIHPDSLLAEIFGLHEVEVVSWHHQAARDVPPGWRVTAQTDDGIIEALEHEQHPWAVMVQWHPELAPQDPHQPNLFRALVAAAQSRRKRSLAALSES